MLMWLVDVEEVADARRLVAIYLAHAGSAQPTSQRVTSCWSGRYCSASAASPGIPDLPKGTKRRLLPFLIAAKNVRKRIRGHGAPGKGNTLLNYCGIGTDFLDFTVDRNPYKHGLFTPDMHIPIRPVEAIDEARPDYILILP